MMSSFYALSAFMQCISKPTNPYKSCIHIRFVKIQIIRNDRLSLFSLQYEDV
jgi:hypothetical protein